jgi:hypothetical protein
MKAHKATAPKIVLGIVIGIAILTLAVSFIPKLRWNILRVFWLHAIERAHQRRILLLCETDHQALLKAGREILSHPLVKKKFESMENRKRDGIRIGGVFGVPKGVRIPQTMQNLGLRGGFINYDGYLTLKMHGGMDHFGAKIYPEDFNEPSRGSFKYGNRELLPGLWFYDDGYLHNPEYDKRIDEIIQKGKNK